jgi:hypothetical protein
MKKFALFAFLSLLATGSASAQEHFLNGEWVASSERCNCGNMYQKPSIYESGGMITFTNPCGQSSPGFWVGQGTIRAEVWGLNATIVNRSLLRWNNGCQWTREWRTREYRPGY